MSEVSPRPRGRPRDTDIDRRVLAAVRELLASKGFAAATIQGVARHAQVRPAAIYRRWQTRMALIEEAIFPGLDAVAVEPSGDLVADLHRFVEAYRAVIATTATMAAMPALLSAYKSGTQTGTPRAPQERAWRSARPQFRAILDAAPAHLVDPSLDADDVFDVLIGATLYRSQMLSLGARADTPERTVDILCRALRP